MTDEELATTILREMATWNPDEKELFMTRLVFRLEEPFHSILEIAFGEDNRGLLVAALDNFFAEQEGTFDLSEPYEEIPMEERWQSFEELATTILREMATWNPDEKELFMTRLVFRLEEPFRSILEIAFGGDNRGLLVAALDNFFAEQEGTSDLSEPYEEIPMEERWQSLRGEEAEPPL